MNKIVVSILFLLIISAFSLLPSIAFAGGGGGGGGGGTTSSVPTLHITLHILLVAIIAIIYRRKK